MVLSDKVNMMQFGIVSGLLWSYEIYVHLYCKYIYEDMLFNNNTPPPTPTSFFHPSFIKNQDTQTPNTYPIYYVYM